MGKWVGDGWNEPREYEPGPVEEEVAGKVDEFIEQRLAVLRSVWNSLDEPIEVMNRFRRALEDALVDTDALLEDGMWGRLDREMNPEDWDGPDVG